MKLRRFEIKRYRSIKSVGLDTEDFLVLIGPNNHGKSNFFYALDLFLSSSSKVEPNDFFNRETSEPIEMSALFENLTEPEMEKLRPWTVNGKLTVLKEYVLAADGKSTTNYSALMQVPNESWLSEDFEHYNDRDAVSQLPLYNYLPATGRISKEAYSNAITQYIEANRATVAYHTETRKNPAGFKQVLDGYLPELYLVPAVRDVADETKTSSATTLLGRLVSALIERISEHNPSYQEVVRSLLNLKSAIEGPTPEQKMHEIRELERDIVQELSGWAVNVKIGVEPPDPKSVLALATRITIDDGFESDISQKGHGLQRALMFALMRIWAAVISPETEVRRRSNIFAFEEPELFLHPQVCRMTYQALKQISTVDQIFLCSHSPHFVSLEDYRNIVLIRKTNPTEGTKCFRAREDLFAAGEVEEKKRFQMIQFFNPDRNELFFSRKTVLVEGATEKAVFPLLAKRIGVYDYKISIIDCNSKYNLVLYMRVMNAFKLPYLVIHDEDPIDLELRPGGAREDSQKLHDATRLFNENQNIRSRLDANIGAIEAISPEFETLLGISQNSVDKLGKPYAAVEKYDGDTTIPDIVEKLARIVYS